MKTAKRTLALLLTVCLLCSTLFTSAFAAEGDNNEIINPPAEGQVDTDDTSNADKDTTPDAGDETLSEETDDEPEEPVDQPPEETTPETSVAPAGTDDPAAEPAALSEDDPTEEVTDPVAKIGDKTYETLAKAIEAADGATKIVLQKDTTETVEIPADADITLDLNGKTLSSENVLIVEGQLTVKDSTAKTAPTVDDEYKTVTYEAGTIVNTNSNRAYGTTITVKKGGSLVVESGKIESKANNAVGALGNQTGGSDGEAVNSTIEIKGGYLLGTEGAALIQGIGATLDITGGVLVATDNAAVAGNGTNNTTRYDGGTTINVSGGTLIGHIVSNGYIACGIYHPQEGTLNISDGVIYADGGVGVLMRGGSLNMTGGEIIATGTSTGKVGDNTVSAGGYGIQVDEKSNCYGNAEMNVQVSDGSVSGGTGALNIIPKDETATKDKLVATGGTFSSDITDYVPAGSTSVPVEGEDGKFTVGVDTETAVAQIGNAGFDSLAAAVAAAKDGDTVTLLKDDTVTSPLYVNTGITLDLGKNTVTLKAAIIFANGSSELKNGTITDVRSKDTTSGNYAAVFVQNADTKLKTSDVTIQSYQPSNDSTYNYDLYITNGATVTLGSGTKISELAKTSTDGKTYGVVGVAVMGTSSKNPTYNTTTNLTIEDGVTIETTGFALSTNGDSHGTNITITGGELTSKESTGIYFPSNGKLTISGGTITGETGIEVRAGEVEVSGDTTKIVGTGTPLENDANGNGTTTTGAGIAVVQHTTKLDTKLTVKGGDISGYHAIYEKNSQNNSTEDLEKVVISIEAGDFKSTSDQNVPIAVSDKKEFVKGGNFSNTIDENTSYLSKDLTAELKKSNGDTPYSYYNSVEDALKDAESGDTVTNLNPEEGEEPVPVIFYTVTVTNEGETVASVNVLDGDTYTLPDAPSKSGYKFQGWSDDSKTYSAGEKVEITADTTFTAQWKKKSSSGGSSSSSSSKTELDLDTGKNGDVSVSPKKPGKGDKVTITVEPDDGYVLDSIKVTDDDGDKIKLTEKGDNKFTFTMPSGEVTIKTTFTKAGGEDAPQFSFIDVSTGDWFAPAVDYVSAKGVMNGSNGYFSPYDNLTRGMIAQIFYNLEGGTGSFAIAYPDVSPSDWYANAVSWASANGIMSGYGSGLFGANDSVTREQLALTLYNYAKAKGYNTTASAELTAFADGASTSEWAKPAMQWAVANGLFSGKSGNLLDPQGTATRAEVASILTRFCETITK